MIHIFYRIFLHNIHNFQLFINLFNDQILSLYLYYDTISPKTTEQIDVSIDGIVKKNLLLQPKYFTGTISVNSSKFEFMQPIQFDKVRNTIRLTLSEDIMNTMWIFYDESNLFGRYDGLLSWSIYLDKNLSMITFVPFLNNKNLNVRVTAPCDNREDALKLSRFLNSGGLE